MNFIRTMSGLKASMTCIQTGDEDYENLEVDLKIVAGNKQKLKSNGKVLTIKNKTVPMSRFGTWVFFEIVDYNLVRGLLEEGGVVVAVTWILHNCYPEITAWVSNVDNLGFTFDIKKSSKQKILDEITSGRMKKEIQDGFKDIAVKHGVESYRDIKVKMIRIIPKGQSERGNVVHGKTEDSSHDSEYERMKKVEFVAGTSVLMAQGEFPRAFMRLRSVLEEEQDPVWRIQMLIQKTICASALKNEDECDNASRELIKLMTTTDIPSNIDSASFHDDVTRVIVLHMNNSRLICALETCFAAAELCKKNKDPIIRVENLYLYIDRAAEVLKRHLTNPTSLLKIEIERYLERIEKDLIPFIKKQKNVDDLVKYRYLYYSEYVLASMRNFICQGTSKKLQTLHPNSTEEFHAHNAWADYPFLITVLSSNPMTQMLLKDLRFKDKILEISKDPKKLAEMSAADPRIQATKEIVEKVLKVREELMGVNNEDHENNKKSGGASASGFSNMFGTAQTKEEKAVEEKKKGNDAYKKKNYDEAIAHYNKAIELDPTNMFFYSNKAAVYFLKEDWNLCRDMCLKAIKVEQENKGKHNIDNKDLAKVAARLARCEIRLQHLDAGMKMFDYSLKLHLDPQVESERDQLQLAIMMHLHMRAGNPYGS